MMFGSEKTIIGVIHLPPLPGYPESPGVDAVLAKALADLDALEAGPVEAVLVENENDKPHRVEASSETVAAMTRLTRELVIRARRCRIGVEILLNDPEASLAVALCSGASFIRTDYFVDRMERPEHGGAMHIDPEALMAYRRRIGAEHILVLADIQVKYARMLEPRALSDSAALARRHGADGIVVTGTATGDPPDVATIRQAKSGAKNVPVLIGSGLCAANARVLLPVSDGAIVGTSLKTGDGIDAAKVRELLHERRLCR